VERKSEILQISNKFRLQTLPLPQLLLQPLPELLLLEQAAAEEVERIWDRFSLSRV
jgi:hypothetical protein